MTTPTTDVWVGDCREMLTVLPDASIDAVVTDPPYELGFMGKKWDATGIAYDVAMWAEVLRVLKPGGYVLAFGGTRTYHRMTCAIEDAGFEIRDCLQWIYATGFPKSLNIGCRCGDASGEHDLRSVSGADLSQAVHAGEATREVLLAGVPEQGAYDEGLSPDAALRSAERSVEGRSDVSAGQGELPRAAVCALPDGLPADGESRRLRDGTPASGSAAIGPVPAAIGGGASRRPQPAQQRGRKSGAVRQQRGAQTGGGSETASGTVCTCCGGLTDRKGWGTALKPANEPIVLARKPLVGTVAANVGAYGTGAMNIDGCRIGTEVRMNAPAGNKPGGASLNMSVVGMPQDAEGRIAVGRWPANVLLDDEAAAVLDGQSGERHSNGNRTAKTAKGGIWTEADKDGGCAGPAYFDKGGASRFFYVAKASRSERDAGVQGDHQSGGELTGREEGSAGLANPRAGAGRTSGGKNTHPTVKPITLLRYLVRLITPPGGTVLDPFTGSGTTGIAAQLEGFNFLGIELSDEYADIARQRIAAHTTSDAQEAA